MKAINILASTVAVLLVASSATAGPSKPGTTELRKPDKKAALEEKTELAGPQDAKTRPRLEPIASTPAQRPLPAPIQRRTTDVVPSGKVNEVEGILAGFNDGLVALDEPLSAEYIALIAKLKQVPVSSVPKVLRRNYRVDASMSRLRLERRVGDRVRLKLGRDANTIPFVIDVSDAKK